MSEHNASIRWKREGADFEYSSYNRDHIWNFGAEEEIKASAAPEFKGSAELVDPEQALVASLSSCHMLTFLALASRAGYSVDEYTDDAVGYLEKNEEKRLALTRVMLSPKVRFSSGVEVLADEFQKLHHRAHEQCFIANSVKTQIEVKALQI